MRGQEQRKKSSKRKKRHAKASKISKEEVGSLYDLLSRVFKYDPEDRISTVEIEKHEWFTKDFPA